MINNDSNKPLGKLDIFTKDIQGLNFHLPRSEERRVGKECEP